MQTAQRIIYHYRRRRFILCIALAILTLIVTLGLRYITERSDNRHEIVEYSQRAIASLEKVLEPIEVARKSLVTLPGIPCDMTQYQLREQAARLQTVRSIALVKMARCTAPVFLVTAIFRLISCNPNYRRRIR